MNTSYVEDVRCELGELVPQLKGKEGTVALWAYQRGERKLAYLLRASARRWRVLMANYNPSLFESAQAAVQAIELRERRRTVPLERVGRLLVRMGMLSQAPSLRTLARWASQGRLKAHKVRAKGRGGEWRVRLGDLHEFVPPKKGRI